MNPFTNYKEDVNYWDVDSQLTSIEPFKSLYVKDKGKKKSNSSQQMWAIAFYIHPESRLANYSSEERKSVIEDDIITWKDFSWNELKEAIEVYKKLMITQAQRSLINWKNKLEERDSFLLSVPYKSLELGEAEKLDKLLAGTPKLYEQYNNILESIQVEEAKGRTKGGRAESASEKGEL